jgi:ABC-type phosphate transport system permease subunit
MERRFRALRIIATIYKIVAVLILLLGVLFAILSVASALMAGAAMNSQEFAGVMSGGIMGVVVGTAVLLYAAVIFLVLYGAGEAIYLALAIEENTRETAMRARHG